MIHKQKKELCSSQIPIRQSNPKTVEYKSKKALSKPLSKPSSKLLPEIVRVASDDTFEGYKHIRNATKKLESFKEPEEAKQVKDSAHNFIVAKRSSTIG